MKHENIKKLIDFFRTNELTWESNRISGKITVDEKIRKTILEIDDDPKTLCQVDISRRNNKPNILNKVENGENIDLEITIDRNERIFIGFDIEDLLSFSNGLFCKIKPKEIYLASPFWNSVDTAETPASIAAYYETIRFIDNLKENIATHFSNEELILIGTTEKVEIPISFTSKTITVYQNEILDAIASIKSIFGTEIRKEEKYHHLKAVIVDQLRKIEKSSRLDHLIKNLKTVNERFHYNFEVFISTFSFETDHEKIQGENRSYTKQITDAMSGIQSRIIAIPFGTIIPAMVLQAKIPKTSETTFAIYIASAFIVINILLMTATQFISVLSIRKEYSEKQKRMKAEIPLLAEKSESSYNTLNKHFYINVSIIFLTALFTILFAYLPAKLLITDIISMLNAGKS